MRFRNTLRRAGGNEHAARRMIEVEDQKKNEREQVDEKNWNHCFSLVSQEGNYPSEKIDDGYAKQNNQK